MSLRLFANFGLFGTKALKALVAILLHTLPTRGMITARWASASAFVTAKERERERERINTQ